MVVDLFKFVIPIVCLILNVLIQVISFRYIKSLGLLKSMVIGFLLFHVLVALIPGIMWLFPKVLNTFGNFKGHPIIQVFEVVLLGFFVKHLQEPVFWDKAVKVKLVKIIAVGLFLLYSSLILLVFGIKFASEKINFVLQVIYLIPHRHLFGFD